MKIDGIMARCTEFFLGEIGYTATWLSYPDWDTDIGRYVFRGLKRHIEGTTQYHTTSHCQWQISSSTMTIEFLSKNSVITEAAYFERMFFCFVSALIMPEKYLGASIGWE